MRPLLDAIVKHIPAPTVDADEAFRMAVTMRSHDPFVGRMVTGRIHSGRVSVRSGYS